MSLANKAQKIVLTEAEFITRAKQQELARNFNTPRVLLVSQLLGTAGAALAYNAGDLRVAIFALLLPVPTVLLLRLAMAVIIRRAAQWTINNKGIQIHDGRSIPWRQITNWSVQAYAPSPSAHVVFTVTVRKRHIERITCEGGEAAEAFRERLAQNVPQA